jgi:tripartite-type tricarboxylate transporter receptor subunit TctC
LEKSLIAALNSADVKSKFNDSGYEVVANVSGEFAEFLNRELSRWKKVIDTGKITAEQ